MAEFDTMVTGRKSAKAVGCHKKPVLTTVRFTDI